MKLDRAMQSTEVQEEKVERNCEIQISIKNGGAADEVADKEHCSKLFLEERRLAYLRWDNLLHINVQFYLNEEFLWEKGNRDITIIKDFCVHLLKEKVFCRNKSNDLILNKEVGNFSLDFLELASHFMARRIMEEIQFYDKVKPFDIIKEGIFGSGSGLLDEHLISINLNLKWKTFDYQDSFDWDIVNETNIPEEFAEKIVQDLNLPVEFTYSIAMEIRKQVKDYVFDLFNNFTQSFVKVKEESQKKRSLQQEAQTANRLLYSITDSMDVTKEQTLEKQIASESIIANETKRRNAARSNIFATYQVSSTANTNQNELNTPIRTWNNYLPNHPFFKLDDKLTRPVHFLFDYKLDSHLGSSSFNLVDNKSLYTKKPEFLRNKLQRKNSRKYENEFNHLLTDNTNSTEKEFFPTKNKNKSINNKSKVKTGGNKKTSNLNSRIKTTNKSKPINGICNIDKNFSLADNEHIIEVKDNNILIKKNIYSYLDYYEKIVIFKKDIEPFNNNSGGLLKQNEMIKEEEVDEKLDGNNCLNDENMIDEEEKMEISNPLIKDEVNYTGEKDKINFLINGEICDTPNFQNNQNSDIAEIKTENAIADEVLQLANITAKI